MDVPKYWNSIVIQGRGDHPSWVTTLKIVSTKNGKSWKYVGDGKIYEANIDQNLQVVIDFDEPIFARALRLYPQTWHNNMSLRFDAVYLHLE